MLKAQLVEAFKRIYRVLPSPLQRSFWTVMTLTVVVALTEFALAGAVSLLGVVLASPQTIVHNSIMQQLVLWLPALRPAMEDPRLLLALLLCLLCGTTLLKTVMLALLTWRQSRYSQMVSRHLGIRLYQGYMYAPYLWHTGQKVSDLITLLNWRANTGIFLFQSLQALSQLLVVATLLVAVCCMAPLAGILVVSITGVAAWGIFRCSRRWVRKFSQQCAAAQQDSMKLIHTGLNGIRDILICQQQENFIRQYTAAEQRFMQGQSVLPVFPPMPSWILEFVGPVPELAGEGGPAGAGPLRPGAGHCAAAALARCKPGPCERHPGLAGRRGLAPAAHHEPRGARPVANAAATAHGGSHPSKTA